MTRPSRILSEWHTAALAGNSAARAKTVGRVSRGACLILAIRAARSLGSGVRRGARTLAYVVASVHTPVGPLGNENRGGLTDRAHCSPVLPTRGGRMGSAGPSHKAARYLDIGTL